MNAAPLDVRFWAKVERRGERECWPWASTLNKTGYGTYAISHTRRVYAHRIAWELANGRVPGGPVCHACDNPACCNPAHLWVGTQADNIRDMVAKGRHANQRKTHCKNGHEYTPENTYRHGVRQVRNCRACHLASDLLRRLAKATGGEA